MLKNDDLLNNIKYQICTIFNLVKDNEDLCWNYSFALRQLSEALEDYRFINFKSGKFGLALFYMCDYKHFLRAQLFAECVSILL